MTELTILMPCLNEAASIGFCIDEARAFLESRGIDGEILIADNGSTDGSREIAIAHGARIANISEPGYGSAIIGGISAAQGKYIIMGDSDASYDFSNLDSFVEKLRQGYHLVVGNRYANIEKGAMPFAHRYIGVPLLSMLGRLKYHVEIKDFHCGLRGFDKQAAEMLKLSCPGMEFSTEIIGKFAASGAKITQLPTVLRRDRRNGKPHLRTIRDGWRHLCFILFAKTN